MTGDLIDLSKEEGYNSILRLAASGATPETLSGFLGLSQSEFSDLLKSDKKLNSIIAFGKSTGAVRGLNYLSAMLEEGKSLDAIKYYLSLLEKSYVPDNGKGQTVNIQTNLAVRLPTIAEAREIIDADPSLLPESESN